MCREPRGQDVSFSGGGSTVDMYREPHAVKMSHLSAAFTCQVPSLGGGFHCRRGGGALCREPHAVKMSHLWAAFTCQDVPSLGGGFHCRRGGGGGGGLCREPHAVKMSHL